jgi:hypothetical protein
MNQATAIRQKINREHQRRCWKLFRNIIHGSKTVGRISHVLIPQTLNNTQLIETPPTRIQIKTELDPLVLKCNIKHFSQAHNTPFTIQPILQLFGDGCTSEALDALNGNIPTNITKHSQMLLQHMKRVREPLPLDMTFEDMCRGYSKWREQTTTSPSNKHRGIYKSLLIAIKFKIYTKEETTNNVEYSDTTYQSQNIQHNIIPVAETALKIQYYLMTLAVKHCHTYKRWQVVHNFPIEKTPGIPLINIL